ncbi:YoaK family protein [Kitasatospora sp. NPDC048540]|uniref:YoaK family protein n=1 Tax=unclassified Kitasatospora TaxID=2633591 RepID=UPI0007C785C0|nr:YoaK family protein [Kitasatospora sp. MBT63]
MTPAEQARPRGLPPGRRAAVTRCLLVLAAGAANAFGFLALGGVFTSVVTANSALLGVYVGTAHFGAARPVGATLLGYVFGAAVGTLLAAGRGRLPGSGRRGLLLETALLWLVVAGWLDSDGAPDAARRTTLLVLTAAAMGSQNAGARATAGGGSPTAFLTGLLTSTIAEFVGRGRLLAGNLAVVGQFITGAAAAGAAFRWLHPAAPVLPALLVSAALLSFDPTDSRLPRTPAPPPKAPPAA